MATGADSWPGFRFRTACMNGATRFVAFFLIQPRSPPRCPLPESLDSRRATSSNFAPRASSLRTRATRAWATALSAELGRRGTAMNRTYATPGRLKSSGCFATYASSSASLIGVVSGIVYGDTTSAATRTESCASL